MSVATKQAQDVEQAINKLKSLHDGDVGVVETVACGEAAIPLLQSLLFKREPSGLFDTRCRAVEVLAMLGAYEVLIRYLEAGHAASDPVERLGDDAVINAAARSLAGLREQRVFLLLSRLAERPSLTGAIRALGSFGRAEAIPLLINALEDDASRPVAEAALRKMGDAARESLIASAQLRLPSPERESESSARRRRSSLGLLYAIGIPQKMWPRLRHLMRDTDSMVAILACKLCLVGAPAPEQTEAIKRLIDSLSGVDWMLRDDIEACLTAYIEIAKGVIEEHLAKTDVLGGAAVDVLRRVRARAK